MRKFWIFRRAPQERLFRNVEHEARREAPAIVFVHGLASGSNAWASMYQLCESDPSFAKYELDTFTYPTSLFRLPLMRVMPKIQHIAKGLNTFIKNHHANRRVVLVCHSLGGLVARQLMVDLTKEGVDVSRFSLVLFACPNNGSALAQVAMGFSIGHRQLAQLSLGTRVLIRLNQDWIALSLPKRVSVVSVAGGSDSLVTPEDALAFCGEARTETVINADHSSIIRPISAQDDAYLVLRRAILGSTPETQERVPQETNSQPNPLFEVYSTPHEPFYVQRPIDHVLEDEVATRHVWLHGESGMGKTAALRRRSLNSGAVVHQVALSSLEDAGPLSIIRTICQHLFERLDQDVDLATHDTPALIRAFCAATRGLANGGTLCLIIEEIPLTGHAQLAQFLDMVFRCIQALESETNAYTRIFLSSIYDPREDLEARKRVEDKLHFIETKRWRHSEILRLAKLISQGLDLPLEEEQVAALTAAAGGSPRYVKRFFRNWRTRRFEHPTFGEILKLTNLEQV